MASPVPGVAFTKGPGEILTSLVRNMESDPSECRKQIRQLLDENPRSFLSAAIEVMKEQADARGAQFVARLLVTSGLLLPALCDPSLSYEQALAIARLAVRADSMKEVMLGRASADRVASSQVIRILERTAGGRDSLPLLLRLLRQPNPYLRSKAVLMLGRDTRNVTWVKKILADADPRIRANAVEALWGVDTPEARELLGSLREDVDNRVAGNALLGLYRLGDATVIPEIAAMMGHEEPKFRATSAWVMGETGHPRFERMLSDLLKDPHTMARRTAIAAISRVHRAVARARQLPIRRLAAHFRNPPSKGERRITLAISALAGTDISPILPTHVALAEDSKAVLQYRLEQPQDAERSAVAFLLPSAESGTASSWSSYTLACLTLKRPPDTWSCVPYASGVLQSGDAPAEETPPHFDSDEAAIRENFSKLPLRPTRNDIWHTIFRAVRPETACRHLIICNDSPSDRAPGPGLIASVQEAGTLVQVISSVPNGALESLCTQVHGVFQVGHTPGALAALVEQAYLNLQVHYEIAYQPMVERPKKLKVMLCHPAGWGETVLAVPQPQ